MNLGRYTKALAPFILGVMSPVEDWGLTGRLDWPHERFALVMLAVAGIVYLLPNVPMPTPEPVPVVLTHTFNVPSNPGGPPSHDPINSLPLPDDGEAMRTAFVGGAPK